MSVREVTDADFTSSVIERSREIPVVVDFWATWCAPCRQLSPIIDRVAGEYAGTVEAAKMDVDANPQTAGALGIQSIPTVVAFRDGAAVDAFLGAQPEPAVREFFARLAPSETDKDVERAAALPDDQAEPALRALLKGDPDHRGAILDLARILLRRGETGEVGALLARIPEDDETRRVAAEAGLASAGAADLESLAARAESDPGVRVEYGRALGAAGRHEEAFEQLLTALRDGERDAARDVIVDLFAILGAEHPLVARYRRELANALF